MQASTKHEKEMDVHRLKLDEDRLMQDKIAEEKLLKMLDSNTMDPMSISFWEFTRAAIMRLTMAWSAEHTGGGDDAHTGGKDGAKNGGVIGDM